MARNKGIAPFSANFERQIAAPLDASQLCPTVAELYLPATWTANDGSIYTYKGMLVSVHSDPTPSLNGIYRLAGSDYTQASNWIKGTDSLTTYYYLYVDGAVSSSGDGLSWDSAFKTINEAITFIQGKKMGNCQIYIRGGTYNEGIVLNSNDIDSGALTLVTDTSDVILTGFTGTTTQYAIQCLGKTSFGISAVPSRKFIIRPTGTTGSTVYGISNANYLPRFQALSLWVDFSLCTAGNRYGVLLNNAMGVLSNTQIDSATIAVYCNINSTAICTNVTGTGNTRAFMVAQGGRIFLSTGNTIAGNYDTTNGEILTYTGQHLVGNALATIASASTIAPVSSVFHVTGTTTIDTITPPYPAISGMKLTLIPDEVFSLSATGNIAVAVNAEIGKTIQIVYDSATLKWYPQQIGSGEGGSIVEYTNTLPTPVVSLGIPAGSTFNKKTMQEMFDMLLYPELFPSLSNPSASFNLTFSGLHEVDEIIPLLTFTSTFNRGSINPAYGTSGFRAGLPNRYELTGIDLLSEDSSLLSNIKTISNYMVEYGVQSWGSRVFYNAGDQPLSNKGIPFNTPLPAGNTNNLSVSITGVYPYFATTSNITTLSKQALALMNSSYVQVTMVAEDDTNKQRIEFPVVWSTITGIQVFNTISSTWEWIGGSKANSLLTFTYSNTTKIIQGSTINYSLWTHNGVKVGSRQLRFYTT